MQLQTEARDHAAGRIALADGATVLTAQAWARVDPASIVASWTAELPTVTAATTRAQYSAASTADPYVDGFDLAGAGVEDNLNPSAFAGTASDGRGLVGLLMSPAFQALQMIGAGLLAPDAMHVAGQHLETIVRTQVADAGRLADGVALTAHKRIDGYVRVVAGGACSRCVVLAGKWYRWNEGFLRHPNCHCVHAPSAHDVTLQNPKRLYDAMTPTQRRASGWSAADQQAIGEGADLSQVTNARRGVYLAGGKRYTTAGTTRRGTFGGYRIDPDTGRLTKRPRGERAGRRLTPDQIYAQAGEDRDAAIRLLRENGYLKPVPATTTTVRRDQLVRAAARPSGAGAARGVARTAVEIRPELATAGSATSVTTAFRAEAKRITGRDIDASFAGSTQTAREHAEGLLRGLERFPEADLTRVVAGGVTDAGRVYAEAEGGTIHFDLHYSSGEGRRRYLRDLAKDVDAHWHPAGMDTPAGIAIHEFGHIIDLETIGQVARPEIEQVVHAAALRAGVTDGEIIRFEVSRYAAEDFAAGVELAAEAFADVMLNGAAASRLSSDIYGVLRRHYEAGGRVFTATPRVIAGAVADPLAGKTLVQLKAIAKDRGVTGYSRLKKDELLARLRATTAAPVDLSKLTVKELRALAKDRGVTGYSSMTKPKLVERLTQPKSSTVRPSRTNRAYEKRQVAVRDAFQAGGPERILGSGSQGQTTLLDASTGRRVVRKTFRHTDPEPADAEELGARVLDALGVRAPATVRLGPAEVGMEYIPGKLGRDLVPWGQGVPAAILDSDDGRMMGLADILMRSSDRNAANWIQVRGGRLAGIDHGFAFQGEPLFGGYSEFGRHFVRDDPTSSTGIAWRDGVDVSHADIAIIRERLDALRPEFDRLGRGGWWQNAMDNLAEVERRATGTRNRLTR